MYYEGLTESNKSIIEKLFYLEEKSRSSTQCFGSSGMELFYKCTDYLYKKESVKYMYIKKHETLYGASIFFFLNKTTLENDSVKHARYSTRQGPQRTAVI